MKKQVLAAAVAGVLGVAAVSAQAALVNGSTLSIAAGSNFEMEVAPGFFLTTQITGLNGIVIGSTQTAAGSHSGAPDGSESPDIDNPWLFFSNTGMHQTTSPSNILSDDGAGNVTLDFSGWDVTWNGIASIPMGAGAWDGNPDGVAIMTCGVDCGDGDTYSIAYSARVPAGDPSSFGNVAYRVTMSGTITAPPVGEIPVPAAVWLFGSGLVGLVGVARRKKAA
jgi:hypothetical protein